MKILILEIKTVKLKIKNYKLVCENLNNSKLFYPYTRFK